MSDSFKGPGKAMLYVGWLLVLGVLVYLFGGWEREQVNPNASYDTVDNGVVREIILRKNRYDHYVLNARVNGVELTFLVDTGATDVVLTESQARKAGLTRGPGYPVSTANGIINVYSSRIDRLQLGGIELRNVEASINPHMGDDTGLLGMSALSGLEWYQKGDELTIIQQL